jgi:hypothetical protein
MESSARPTVLADRLGEAGLFALRGRATCWSSRAGRAADRELEPTFFSHAAFCSRRDDVTSVVRGGDVVDDPDMSLQSTAALATSPLHDGSDDGSSLEETPLLTLLMSSIRNGYKIHLYRQRQKCRGIS